MAGSVFEMVDSLVSELPWWGWVLLGVLGVLGFVVLRGKNSKLPPGPGALPIVGSFPLMGAKDDEPAFHMFHRLGQKFGPVVYLTMGNCPTIIISDAEMAKIILRDQDQMFASRPFLTAGKHLGFDFQSLVFAPAGPYYKRLRKIFNSELLSPKRVVSSHETRENGTYSTLKVIYRELKGGQATNLTSCLKTLSLNNLMSMIFGSKEGTLSQNIGKVSMDEMHDVVRNCCEIAGVFNFGDYIPIARWLDLQGVVRRMKALRKRMQIISAGLIEEHYLRKLSRNVDDQQPQTILDVLLSLEGEDKLSDDAIAGAIFDMIIAGSDTTSASSDWTIAELTRQPQLLKKLKDELDAVVGKDRFVKESDIPNLPYLQCVIKESLRLHPPAPLGIPHCSIEPTKLGNYEIAANTTVLINIWAINRDPKRWENPLQFSPERFENTDMSVFGQDYDLLPFSSGRRGCSGMLLGFTMVQFIVGTLIHAFDFEASGIKASEIDVFSEIPGLVSMRSKDLFVKVTPRLNPQLYE